MSSSRAIGAGLLRQAAFAGRPVEIRYQANLRDTSGHPAHAAAFIRPRIIILDEELRTGGPACQRILCHELFHFAWLRLGNPRRLAWERLLTAEWDARTRGEAGWSAEWRKQKLRPRDVAARTRRWREYCCESFCDTGAWIFTSDTSEFTLGKACLKGRKSWFARHLTDGNRGLGVSI